MNDEMVGLYLEIFMSSATASPSFFHIFIFLSGVVMLNLVVTGIVFLVSSKQMRLVMTVFQKQDCLHMHAVDFIAVDGSMLRWTVNVREIAMVLQSDRRFCFDSLFNCRASVS